MLQRKGCTDVPARQESRMVAGAASFRQRPAPLDSARLSTAPRYSTGATADTDYGAQLLGLSDEWRRALLRGLTVQHTAIDWHRPTRGTVARAAACCVGMTRASAGLYAAIQTASGRATTKCTRYSSVIAQSASPIHAWTTSTPPLSLRASAWLRSSRTCWRYTSTSTSRRCAMQHTKRCSRSCRLCTGTSLWVRSCPLSSHGRKSSGGCKKAVYIASLPSLEST